MPRTNTQMRFFSRKTELRAHRTHLIVPLTAAGFLLLSSGFGWRAELPALLSLLLFLFPLLLEVLLRIQGCVKAWLGVIRCAGSHSKQRFKKSIKFGSEQLFRQVFQSRLPGVPRTFPRRLRPGHKLMELSLGFCTSVQ